MASTARASRCGLGRFETSAPSGNRSSIAAKRSTSPRRWRRMTTSFEPMTTVTSVGVWPSVARDSRAGSCRSSTSSTRAPLTPRLTMRWSQPRTMSRSRSCPASASRRGRSTGARHPRRPRGCGTPTTRHTAAPAPGPSGCRGRLSRALTAPDHAVGGCGCCSRSRAPPGQHRRRRCDLRRSAAVAGGGGARRASGGRGSGHRLVLMSDEHGFSTRAIHAGQEADELTGAVVPPIYQVSTYKQDGIGGFRNGYEYSRSANPTRTALEECIAALEGGSRGFAFASGLAGQDTVARALLVPGDHVVVPNDAYGGTYRYFNKVAKPQGVEHSIADMGDVEAVRAAIRPGRTKMVWV